MPRNKKRKRDSPGEVIAENVQENVILQPTSSKVEHKAAEIDNPQYHSLPPRPAPSGWRWFWSKSHKQWYIVQKETGTKKWDYELFPELIAERKTRHKERQKLIAKKPISKGAEVSKWIVSNSATLQPGTNDVTSSARSAKEQAAKRKSAPTVMSSSRDRKRPHDTELMDTDIAQESSPANFSFSIPPSVEIGMLSPTREYLPTTTAVSATVNAAINMSATEEEQPMDWEQSVAAIQQFRRGAHGQSSNAATPIDPSVMRQRSDFMLNESDLLLNGNKGNAWVMVVDTNVLIDARSRSLLNIRNSHKFLQHAGLDKLTVVIPWVVLQEVDGLKGRDELISASRIKNADQYIRKVMDKSDGNSNIKFQSLAQDTQDLRLSATSLPFPIQGNDDRVLKCALALQLYMDSAAKSLPTEGTHTARYAVCLLTNDRLLKSKADTSGCEGLTTLTATDFQQLLTRFGVDQRTLNGNASLHNNGDMPFSKRGNAEPVATSTLTSLCKKSSTTNAAGVEVERMETAISPPTPEDRKRQSLWDRSVNCLGKVLQVEFEAAYNAKLWLQIVCEKPPWTTLAPLLRILDKHHIAVSKFIWPQPGFNAEVKGMMIEIGVSKGVCSDSVLEKLFRSVFRPLIGNSAKSYWSMVCSLVADLYHYFNSQNKP